MSWKTLTLCACALLLVAAKAAPAHRPTPAKPAAAPAAAKAATPAPGGPFDARDPAALVALLETMGAKAQITNATDPDDVFIAVTAPAYGFAAQYAGCAPTKRDCKALAFTTQSDKAAPTLSQINGFNQTSMTCRMWQDKSGKPHVMYSTLVFPATSREEMGVHVGAWQGCLANFGDFLGDPVGYLANAP